MAKKTIIDLLNDIEVAIDNIDKRWKAVFDDPSFNAPTFQRYLDYVLCLIEAAFKNLKDEKIDPEMLHRLKEVTRLILKLKDTLDAVEPKIPPVVH